MGTGTPGGQPLAFYADLQMLWYLMSTPDPGRLLSTFTSREIPSKANGWQRYNARRWSNETYDRTFDAAQIELDPVKAVLDPLRGSG